MLAIHRRPGSFSDKWIEFCQANQVSFKIVDCYASNIIRQLDGCRGLMWHWAHYDHKAVLFARQLTYSLERIGKKIFPNFDTCWHFDDKVGQKYILEAIGAPLVPSYVFYCKQQALAWASTTNYPLVFKLRGGAGSENVTLVKDVNAALKIINKAFGKGFKVKNRYHFLRERFWQFRRDRSLVSLLNISKGIIRLVIPKEAEKRFPRERNYVYFQKFIPDNEFDIRVIVIGNRAFAIKRKVRTGDFRASGSGYILYEQSLFPVECIKLSFDLAKQLRSQCIAFDIVYNQKKPLLVEISYAFAREVYLPCPGYWDANMQWHVGKFVPEHFMLEDFLSDLYE